MAEQTVPLGGSIVADNSKNPTPLPPTVRQQFEAQHNVGLADVRIHTDSYVPVHVGALAYSQGNDIHFAPGQSSPNLLAHELAHVVQQRSGKGPPSQ